MKAATTLGLVITTAWASQGCSSQVRTTAVLTEPASTGGVLSADVERGYLDIVGEGRNNVRVDLESWATASSRRKARDDESRNGWSLTSDGFTTSWITTSPANDAGVDSYLTIPYETSVVALVRNGQVFLETFLGTHDVEAWNVLGRAVEGEGTFIGRNAVELELWPYLDAEAFVQGNAYVDLWLPFGGDYDLEIFHPRNANVSWDDLGFDVVQTDSGYTRLIRGPGTAHIVVEVLQGDFALYESF